MDYGGGLKHTIAVLSKVVEQTRNSVVAISIVTIGSIVPLLTWGVFGVAA